MSSSFRLPALLSYVLCLFGLLSVVEAAPIVWEARPGAGKATVEGKVLALSLGGVGDASVVADKIAVTAGKRVNVSFAYEAQGVTSSEPLRLQVAWLNAAGVDIDDARREIGFPPLARVWEFTKSSGTPIHVVDNLSVPDQAVAARITFSVVREVEGKNAAKESTVRITDFKLAEGEAKPEGLDLPVSGPEDAGTVSAAPEKHAFVPNLVLNGAFEEGAAEGPTGWKVEGDNKNVAAEWSQGGAFSGKRALKIYDRGPYVKSWDRSPGEPYVIGGKPMGNYAGAREEVSARWVSEPVPATPGQAYQSTAFYWFANRSMLDRGLPNPVRIQFLDASGKVLPAANIWQDWLPDPLALLSFPGWTFTAGKPIVAPEGTVSLRAVVALNHAFFDAGEGVVRKINDERGFVLVDNISVYALPENADLKSAPRAFEAAAAAAALPFVPSSPGHRPNTVRVKTVTEHPGGLLVATPEDVKAGKLGTVSLSVSNLLGDLRQAEIAYEIVDIRKTPVGKGGGKVDLPPFGSASLAVALPAGLKFGPYEMQYTLRIVGENEALTNATRFGLMPKRETTVEERGKDDYPFSLWMHSFSNAVGTPEEEILGRLADSAGMGKTWFGLGGKIFPDHYLVIKDPEARKAAMAKRIEEARIGMAAWRKYGVTPMGAIQNTGLLETSQYPVLAEIVETFVSALKDDIKFWRHGTEAMHGGVREMDQDTVEKGLNGQGGQNYLYWGRKGTVRQYWQEYFVARDAAKKADPGCFFGPQTASDTGGNVLRLFFKMGHPQEIDIFGMNTYISAFSIWPANVRELQDNGRGKIPLYVSEFAAMPDAPPTAPDHLVKELEASRKLVSYWSSVLHRFPTFFHLEMWGMILADEGTSLTYQGLVRPQYLAYATMTNLLGAGEFVAHHDVTNAEVFVRKRSVREGYVAVAWAKGERALLELETGDQPVRVVDMWGNSREVVPEEGRISLETTPDPVYIVSSAEVKPGRAVEIDIRHATTKAGQVEIAVKVTNNRKSPLTGKLELLAEGPLRIADRNRNIDGLAPGETTDYRFAITPLKTEDRRIPLQARVVSGEKVYESTASLNFHTARRVSADAVEKLWDWSDEEFTQIANREDQVHSFGTAKPWGGAEDLSARAAFRWDEENLYVTFRVTDDVDMPPDAETNMWQKDVIELLVDVNRGLSSGAPFTMFSLTRFPDGPRLLRHDGVLPQGKVPGSRIEARKEGNVVIYQAAIPWNEMQRDFRPKVGQAIALAWGIDDHDGGNTGRRAISWFTNVTGKDVAKFGDLIMVD